MYNKHALLIYDFLYYATMNETLRMKKLLLMITLVISSMFATASEPGLSPYKVIESAGNKLFARIAREQGTLKTNPDLMQIIVEEELMPSVDYQYASYKILGKHLKQTTKEQRDNFTNAMRQYLVKTYANALTKYKNQQVKYEREQDIKNGKKIVSVDTVIVETGSPEIKITFQLRLNEKTQQWKAYDMIVEGISLLSSKQAEFAGRLAKDGIDKVALDLLAMSDSSTR